MRIPMRQRITAFFSGRNGFDALAKTVYFPSLVLMLCSIFVPHPAVRLPLYAVSLVGLIYATFRIFSRNLSRRYRENASYLEALRLWRLRHRERKTHRYVRCPRCRAWLRLPRKRGRLFVTCRACAHRFDKKT